MAELPFAFEGKPERSWEDYDGFAILGFPFEDVDSDVKRPGLGLLRWAYSLDSHPSE